jgi:hypothetical protein
VAMYVCYGVCMVCCGNSQLMPFVDVTLPSVVFLVLYNHLLILFALRYGGILFSWMNGIWHRYVIVYVLSAFGCRWSAEIPS